MLPYAMTAADGGSRDEKLSFLKLYEKYKRLVLAKAIAYAGDSGSAEDIAQESWIRLLGKQEKLRGMPEGAQVNYIIFTVRSAAFDFRRKRELDHRTEAEYEGMEAFAAPGAEEEFLSRLSEFRIADVWDALTPAEQLLLEGKYLMELDDASLAALLCCRPASIRMLLTRARRRARDLLLERRGKET